MKYSNTIEYNISTKLDSSGLQKLRTELQQVELILQKMGNEKLLDGSFSEAREQIQGLGDALTKAFNPSLGVLDLSTFKTELKESGVTMQGLKNAFTQAGSEGQIAFNNLIGQLGRLDTGIQRSNSQIDKLFTTFSNTFRWGLVSSFFSQFMNAIHSSVEYVKDLDDSLTQIMLVTDYNRDSMNEYAKSANEAAKALSMSTTGMTNASLVFAQQGYDLDQSQELASLSAKLANASQQDTATTSDQITAYMNAYGLEGSIEELTQQMDNWALIANVSAADVGELAQASQRAASMANAVGVSGEQLASQIATIESVTREAPEQIGNGLKTLYARFSDIAAGKEDEDGFTLGKVTSELNKIGVQVLNEMGQIRDVGDIMEDLMVIWDDLDQTSKVAASQALAGKYQVNRFMALMDNSDMYEEYKGATGSAATGTLDQMNQEYAESLAGRTQKLNTTLEGLFNDVFTTDMVYPLIDALTKLADAVDTLFKSIGGGPTIILGLASAFTRLFSNNIAEQINNAAMNKAVQQQRIENSQNRGALLEQLKVANPDENNQNTQAIINYAQRINELAPNLSSEQWEQANQILKEMVQNANAATQAQGELKTQLESVGTIIGSVFGDRFKAPFLDEAGGINAASLIEDLKTANLADSKESIKETKDQLLKFNQGLQEYQSELNKSEDEDKDFSNSLQRMSESLQELKKYMEPGLYNRLNSVFKELGESFDLGNASIEEITTTIKQFEGETGRVIEFLDKLSNKELSTQEIENFIKKLEELAFKAKNTEGAAEGSNKVGASFLGAAEKQLNVKDIVDMVANIGQLSFAWQSFQSLGSLWQKTDISTGEKIQQTIANLTASIPMLYTSWKKITEILKIPSFKDSTANIQQAKDAITNAQNQMAQAQEKINQANSKAQAGFKALSTTLHNTGNGAAGFAKKASNGMHEVAQAANEMDKAQKDAAAATADLRQAQLSLAGSLAFAAIGIGLAIASAAWGAYQQKIQNAMAAEKEALDKAKATADETSSAVGEWQKLYDEYLKTGEASDALISSSDQLSEKLGILGGDAYIAAGNFEKLAEEIQKAADADAEDAIKTAGRLLDGTYGKSLNGDIPLNGSAQEDYSKALHDSTFDLTSQMLFGSGVTGATAQLRDWIDEAGLMPQAADTVADSIGKAHQALALIEEKQDEVNEKLKENPTDQALIDLADQLSTGHTALSEFLNLEDIKGAEDAYKVIAENTLRLSGTQKSLNRRAENGMSGEELLDYISNLEGVSDYFKTLESDADRARFAISLLGEGAASVSIELDNLFNEDEGIFDNFSDKDKDSIKTSLKESGLTPEEQLKVVASIDEEQSLDEIQDFIEKVAEKIRNGTEISDAISEVLSSIPVKDLLFNSYSQEDIDAILKKAKLEDVNIEDYANIFKETGGAGVTKDQINVVAEEIDNLTASLKELEEAGDTSSDKYKSLQKDLQNAEGILQDLAVASLETSNGMDDLSEKWEDISAAINSGDPSAMAASYSQLQEILSELLNVDPSMITSEFMQNNEVLSALGDLANGDTEAIWRLREAFGNEDLVLNARLDAVGFEGDREKFFNLVKIAQEQLPELEVGAHLDNEEFIQGLEDMLNNTELSSKQMQAILDTFEGLGYDVQVEDVPFEVPNIDLKPSGGSITLGGSGAMSDLIGGAINKGLSLAFEGATSLYTEITGKEATMPKITLTKKGNPKGGDRYRSNTGGRGGGGGKGKSCFVAGTLITTLIGFSPIEQIKQGDTVLSYNESLHQLEYSTVVQTMIHDVIEPIYTLHIKNERLRVTGIHRFLVSHDIFHSTPQWVPAADLQIGDWMFLADGTWHLIHNIEVNVEHQTVYNFEVAGNHNYYVGRNQILAHNKGGSGGKKGGGGGSGGKAKTIEPKEKKEHQKDYYEEVNTQLDKTEKILSKIEKEEDRLIGDKARANQNKQLSLLQKEIELNKEKQEIQQQELKDVDELMKKRAKEARELAIKNGITAIIPSPIYDEDGAIANYEEMSAAIDKIHNQFIDQYNAAAKAGNEELTKEIQKTLEKFDKYGEDLLKNAQRHDKLQSEIEETINTLEELEDAIEDIRIDAFKAHQEAQDDLKDLKEDAAELASIFRDFNDDGFLTDWSLDDTPIDDMIKAMYELDDIYSVTQEDANKFYQDLIDKKEEALKNTTDKDEIAAIQSAIQYFQEQQANLGPDNLQNGLLGLANQDLDKLKGWIDGTNTEPNPFGKNEAALWEAYEDAYKRATDLFKDWRETVQDLRDSIIDTYDEQEDAINNNIDEYDRLLDHLERIGDTYALYYGEDSYDNILTIMDRQGATMQQQLDDLTAAFNYWEQRYQEAIANGDEKLIQEIKEKMEDAEDAMYDKAEELAEHWVDRYEKAVDASIQKIDIKLWGGGPGQTDLEDQSTIWELQKDYMNTYKDDVEKAYEIDKLRSKYIDLLNDAQGMSLGTQNRIRKQMEDQLKLLESQNTVSEYDVKLANAKLEVLQKQMALEDAQRNKNKMQLRRDTQGNYRYVYRADEGNVKQAQDELAESEFDAYEMTKEQTIANNDRAVSLYQDYMNKMRDIANKYQDDEVARNAALLALKEEYGKLLGALGEDFQNTTDGMYEVLTWLVKNGTEDTTTAAKNMMDQFYENAHEVKENTGNDWRDLATQITKDVLPNIQTAVEQGIGDIDTEATNLSKNLVGDNGVLNKIKSSTKMLEQGMMDATDTTEKWAKATRDLFESFSPDNKKVQEAMTQLKQMEEQLSANQQATSALSTKYKQANAALQAKTAEAEHYKTALDFSTGAKQVKTGTVVKLKKGTAVHYSRNNSQTDKQGHYGWSLPYDMWVKFGEIDKGQANPYSFYATGDSLKQFGPIQNDDKSDNRGGEADTNKRHHQPWWFDQSELQKNVLAAMDTGGYTGSWNDNTSLYKNGKIAMLHQKELVLNATDTQNILTAVSLMRDMIAGSTNGLFNMNGLKNNISSSYNPVTEQRVEIQASFPNATDADDIRRALINLSDNAYQYSYRTR